MLYLRRHGSFATCSKDGTANQVEPIEEDVLAGLIAEMPGLHIINGYGPTETTVCATLYSVPGTKTGRRAPIGTAVRNTQLYVADADRNLVPYGVPGELYVGGDGLALGYLNRPDLDRGRFVENPFSPDPGRLYRTGDRVRYLPDGTLQFLGRVDHQIKIRGHRVEPAEIELALTAAGEVEAALATTDEGPNGQVHLVAYLVPAEGAVLPDAQTWFQRLQRTLPTYMIPTVYVGVPAFPLTASGKIDRRALSRPSFARMADGTAQAAPRTETESALARIWSDVLGLETLGVEVRFFDLGGDSIDALRIASRAHDAGLAVTPRQIFEAQTIARLAELAGQSRGSAAPQAHRAPGIQVEADLDGGDLADLLTQFGEDV